MDVECVAPHARKYVSVIPYSVDIEIVGHSGDMVLGRVCDRTRVDEVEMGGQI